MTTNLCSYSKAIYLWGISKFIQNMLFFNSFNTLRGETKEVQNSYSWSSQRGKSHKIRAFLKKEKKKNLHENTLPYSKIIPASGYLIGQKLFLLLKGASTVWKRRVSVLVSMQLVLMTVPFPPVFAVVHPPVKQTKPYEAQQCSLLFKTWFKNQAWFSGLPFLLAHTERQVSQDITSKEESTNLRSLRKQPTFCDATTGFSQKMMFEEWAQKFHTGEMSLPRTG